MVKSSLRVVAGAVCALGLLAGCGGGEKALPSKSMTVVGREMAFDAPDRVEPGEYTIKFENVGAQYHELAVKDSAGKVLMRRSIAGGTLMAMKVRLEAGTYELGCFEPGHYAAGMHKTLTVAAAS